MRTFTEALESTSTPELVGRAGQASGQVGADLQVQGQKSSLLIDAIKSRILSPLRKSKPWTPLSFSLLLPQS